MSAHGANPIFVNEKIKIGPPEHLLTPNPQRRITSHFYLTPNHLHLSGRHLCMAPNIIEIFPNIYNVYLHLNL